MGENVQAIKKIPAKSPLLDLFRQITVGGGDYADVDRNILRAAESFKGTVF